MAMKPTDGDRAHHANWARILLLIPFVGALWVPFYNTVDPTLFGIPFFYWFQLFWILLSAVVTVIVYRAEH